LLEGMAGSRLRHQADPDAVDGPASGLNAVRARISRVDNPWGPDTLEFGDGVRHEPPRPPAWSQLMTPTESIDFGGGLLSIVEPSVDIGSPRYGSFRTIGAGHESPHDLPRVRRRWPRGRGPARQGPRLGRARSRMAPSRRAARTSPRRRAGGHRT